MNVRGRGDVEVRWDVAVLDHTVVADDRAGADGAIEDHAIEAKKNPVADFAGAMDDGAVGNRGALANVDATAGFRMDDYAVLDVGIRADGDGFHFTIGIGFVSTDDRIRADENVFADDNFAADDRRWIDKSRFRNDRQVAGRIFADHEKGSSVVTGGMLPESSQCSTRERLEVRRRCTLRMVASSHRG